MPSIDTHGTLPDAPITYRDRSNDNLIKIQSPSKFHLIKNQLDSHRESLAVSSDQRLDVTELKQYPILRMATTKSGK
jgi:hypothetical protein